MKKIITISISILMIGALFTGCGNKAVTKSTTAKAKTTNTANVPTKDDNGNKLTAAQQKDIADHQKAAADIRTKTDKWVKTLCSITPQNSATMIAKLDDMGETPYLTDQFKAGYKSETMQLINYSISTVKFEKLTDDRTGKTVDGATVYYDLDYKASGVEKTRPCTLVFVPDSKDEMKIAGLSLGQITIKK